MNTIEWNKERFSVGVASLDRQHKELVAMVNVLIENEHLAANSPAIADLLERMTQYAAYHFRTEEQYLIEIGFPGYAAHENEHTEFKARTASFCVEAMLHKPALAHELLAYLSTWLVHHILYSDMQYKAFTSGREKSCGQARLSARPIESLTAGPPALVAPLSVLNPASVSRTASDKPAFSHLPRLFR